MTIILILLAILFLVMIFANASMDALAHHFPQSIFKDKDPFVWDPKESWRNKYEADGKTRKKFLGIVIPAVLSDPWHRFKGAMLASIFLSQSVILEQYLFAWWINFLIYVLLWTILFEIIYNIFSGKPVFSAWIKKK